MSTPLRTRPLEHRDLVPHVDHPWPLPGAGQTSERWDALADVARSDLALAKLVEPHHDAAAILAELGEEPPTSDEIWAVWAAAPPFAVLRATDGPSGWRLSGSKAFCSGAPLVTHALVTAETDDGGRLFAIDRAEAGITRDTHGLGWVGHGMGRASTETLAFDDVAARPVGEAGAYVDRPGFWLGAIGVAACWLGGARGIADTLENASGRLDPHGLAHLGAVRSDLDTLALAFEAAARRVDAGPQDVATAERLAQSLRARTAVVVDDVISHVGRALGPGPLAFDAPHAEQVADLQVFVRQHHAERDLARLGSIGADDA